MPASASRPTAAAATDDAHSQDQRPASTFDVDVLSDVLRSVRLTGALFFPMECSSPWVDTVPQASAFAPLLRPRAQHVVSYHVIRRGSCWAGLLDQAPVRLEAGDILVVPHGDAYFMASTPDAAASGTPAEAVLAFFRQMTLASAPRVVVEGGGGPERVDVVCGFLGCDVRPFNPVLDSLPRVVHLRRGSTEAGADRLAQLIEFALAESQRGDPGAKCVLLRLSEILFVEVVRRCLEAVPAAHPGWLAGVRDPLVGRALACLHDRPAEAWTLDRLAKDVGASRSALADRFTHLIGQPPMRYLTQWRLQLAAGMLADGSAKVSAVALDVGYESEAAFSRAFKKLVGTSPAAWRRRALVTADPVQ
jgi:AraC-like DNA-binding protein